MRRMLLILANIMQKTPSFSWASAIIKQSYKQGVRHAVLSPGSRNTSLTLALTHFPGIRCISVIDERSAGFVALGMSKISRRPTLLCCTSGTAGANYYPAVIEAYHSSIPMIIITADRPAHLQQVGASQTIQQKHLFGSHVLDFLQLPEVNTDEMGEPLRAQEELIRAFQLAYSGGPVHINAPFNKPFEPTPEQLQQYRKESEDLVHDTQVDTSSSLDKLSTDPLIRPELLDLTSPSKQKPSVIEDVPSSGNVTSDMDRISKKDRWLSHPEQLQDLYTKMSKPMIVVGSDPTPFQWFRLLPFLAKHPNAQIILETGASLFGWEFDESNIVQEKVVLGWEKSLYDSERLSLSPFRSIDGMVRLGKEVVNPSLARFLSEYKHLPQLRFITHEPYEDALASSPYFIAPEVSFSWVDFEQNHALPASNGWYAEKDELQENYINSLRQYFHQARSGQLTDGAVFYRLSTIIPSSIPIFFSNSFPVRDQALFAPAWSVNNPLIAQRGAAGIDGISSTAFGVSLSTDLAMAVVTGDISFLYDINALLSARLLTKPLVIFVINNGGGSIFTSLPVQQAVPESMEWFLTPQKVSIEHLAKSYGLFYSKIVDSDQLWEARWAEEVQQILQLHHETQHSSSERNHHPTEALDKTEPVNHELISDASNVRIVEFVTKGEASNTERSNFRS